MSPKPLRFNRVWAIWAPLLIIVDASMVFSGGQLVSWALAAFSDRENFWPLPDSWYWILVGTAAIYPLILQTMGLYRPVYQPFVFASLARRIMLWAVLMLGLVLLLFLTKTGALVSRLWVANWFVVVCIGQVAVIAVIYALMRYQREKGFGFRRVLIVGSGPLAQRAASLMLENTWLGLKPVGYLREDGDSVMPKELPCLATLDDVEKVVACEAIDEVWLTLPFSEQSRIQRVLKKMRQNLVDVRLVPDIFMYDVLNRELEEIMGLPVIGLTTSPHRGLDLALKRCVDFVGGFCASVLLLPVLLICALLVKLDSPGAVIFRQQRHGLDGKPFNTFKFRTMYEEKNPPSEYRQATRNDPRITRVGRILRKLSLDELPQLWNVLRGEMSLVGPRPHPVNMNISYWDDIDRYALRHRVKPGITGWAQVHGLRGETSDVSLLRKRIEYDLFYIENWSILLDIRILFRTLLVAWFQPAAF